MAETTSFSGPPQWLQQIYQQAIPGFFSIANRPYQQYQGQRVAPMSSITQGALGGIQGAMYGNPATWGGMQFLGDTIGGKYGNQYIDQMAGNITDEANQSFDRNLGQLNSIFDNPNSFGGSRHALMAGDMANQFGKGLGNSLTNLHYNAFNDDMNRRMGAAGQAQSMNNAQMQNLMLGAQAGQIPQQMQQQMLNNNYQDWQNQWNYPQQQAQFLAQMLGMSGQGAGQYTSTQQPNPNMWSQILGGGLLGYSGIKGLFG